MEVQHVLYQSIIDSYLPPGLVVFESFEHEEAVIVHATSSEVARDTLEPVSLRS